MADFHTTNQWDTLSSQSSLVVSWQRIDNSVTNYSINKVFKSHANSCVAIFFNCRLKGLPQLFFQMGWDLGTDPKENTVSIVIVQ
jgi:hypothetical protein